MRRAERDSKGMAQNIRIKTENMPDGRDNLEIRVHKKWKICFSQLLGFRQVLLLHIM
jgi:hypothetical protein